MAQDTGLPVCQSTLPPLDRYLCDLCLRYPTRFIVAACLRLAAGSLELEISPETIDAFFQPIQEVEGGETSGGEGEGETTHV
jgi:hypothetical protein